jgi:hypothetical protein
MTEPWMKTKAYVLRDSETGKLKESNHPDTYLVFKMNWRAHTEAEFLNHKASDAPLRDRYVVEAISI